MSETLEPQRPMIDIALAYAAHGWPVLPLHTPVNGVCDCIRQDCTVPGKHPRTQHGLSEASTDKTQIGIWWSRWSNANIGITTGEASGLIILDLDIRHNGIVSLEALRQQYGHFPTTRTVVTPSGGRHFYFAYPEGAKIGNKIGFREGLDIRGRGGFVVAPSSIGANGKRYEWINASVPIAPLPVWLLGVLVDSKPQQETAATHLANPRIFISPAGRPGEKWLYEAISTARGGTRNHTGYHMARQLRNDGIPYEQAEAIMLAYANAVRDRGDHLYTDQEALLSLKSAYSRPPQDRAKRR